MVFSSLVFIYYFLPLFLLLYYVCGARNGALLFGSIVFYVWGEGPYIFLLGLLIAGNFFIGLAVTSATGTRRISLVIGGVAANLLPLAFFKYVNFIIGTVDAVTGAHIPALDTHLPLGISFFTFQLISYLIDVGRGTVSAERSPIRFATYILMFPHLIAGPIVRYGDIDYELFKRSINLEKIGLGVQFFVVGLCQKVLIANTVSIAADTVFALPAAQLSPSVAWLGVGAYTQQIYFDFCGYSNMAIGLAFLLGFRFPLNFNYPYISLSITEFWRRWHMSLSFWFRDYVYISLGGNRHGPVCTARNLIIVFFLTGLWHGASWTFVLWGMFHGAFIMAERLGLRSLLGRVNPLIAWTYTILVVMIGWVLFRASDLHHAASIIKAMFGLGHGGGGGDPIQLWLKPETMAAMAAGVVFSFPVLPWILSALSRPELAGPVVPGTAHTEVTFVHAIPSALLIVGFCLSSMLLVGSSLNPFLYFRF